MCIEMLPRIDPSRSWEIPFGFVSDFEFRIFHLTIPSRIAVRWMVQIAPRDPTMYPGSASAQRDQ